MLAHNLKISWRSLSRDKGFAFINVVGLAVGMAVTMLIGLWIHDEMSFNRQFANHESLAQVMSIQTNNGEVESGGSVAVPLSGALAENPLIKDVSLVSWYGSELTYAGKTLNTSGRLVQPAFPRMFSLDMIEGSADALNEPTTVLISQSIASALFAAETAIGKVVQLNGEYQVAVGGVYTDFAPNSSFHYAQTLISWNFEGNDLRFNTDWHNHGPQLYVHLKTGADFQSTNAQVRGIPTPHIKEWREQILLHPVSKVYLYDEFVNGEPVTGRIRFVWMFGVIGIFILFVACINFMNLATARSQRRAKEVGVRKAAGASRFHVASQFINESMLMTFIALVLALLLVTLALPHFNALADKSIRADWLNISSGVTIIMFTIVTGFLAGIYPAIYLSAFSPVKVLKGIVAGGRGILGVRRFLMVVQFTVCIALIIGTIVVFRQIQFAKERPAGYSREGLVAVPLTEAINDKFGPLRNELLTSGSVQSLSASSQQTTQFNNNNRIEWAGMDINNVQFFRDVNVSHDYGKTIGWKISQGRDFSEKFLSDTSSAIINEAAQKAMFLTEPVGTKIRYNERECTIVGVVKDMITQSPYAPTEPSVFFCGGWYTTLIIRLKEGRPTASSLEDVAKVFRKYDPDFTFTYRFISDEYAKKFAAEQKIGSLAAFFAAFAIFISCLGLFGLAAYVAAQRTKEIGIRKVLGASVVNVWKLLSREFIVLALVSFFVAIPISYVVMHNWLLNYQYRSQLSWWIFAMTGGGALLLTLITVSFQSIRAALADPVKNLRTE